MHRLQVIEKAVFDELCGLLDSGLPKEKDNQKDKEAKHALRKGRPNVVMFVGLQVRVSLCCHLIRAHIRVAVSTEALCCRGDAARLGTPCRGVQSRVGLQVRGLACMAIWGAVTRPRIELAAMWCLIMLQVCKHPALGPSQCGHGVFVQVQGRQAAVLAPDTCYKCSRCRPAMLAPECLLHGWAGPCAQEYGWGQVAVGGIDVRPCWHWVVRRCP